MKKTIFIVLILIVATVGSAAADPGMPETAETQGFTTATSVDAVGIMTENDAMVWQEVNCGYCGLEEITPLYDFAHDYYVSSYSEDTIADQGFTTYAKSLEIDTARKEANQFNVEAQKVVSFVADDTGRMTSEEDILLDGAGTMFPAEFLLICPFAGGYYSYVPPFCNVVEMGSEVDLYEGAFTTDVEERHIMAANTAWNPYEGEGWPFPVSDPGVEVNYGIILSEVTPGSPAIGSAAANINVHIMEGRLTYPPEKSADLVYSESTTASGAIVLFQKQMSYNSKITAPGIYHPILVD